MCLILEWDPFSISTPADTKQSEDPGWAYLHKDGT